MTWEHLQQLRATARGRIQQGLAALSPQGGNGVVVSGNAISVHGSSRKLPVRSVDWSTIVYATLTQRHFANEGADDYQEEPFEWTGEPVPVLYMWNMDEPGLPKTVPGEASETYPGFYVHYRNELNWYYKMDFKVRFEALSYPFYKDDGKRLKNPTPFYEQRFYRFPVRLKLETFYRIYIEDGPWGVEMVPESKTVTVGPGGVTVEVTPSTMGWSHYLRIVEARREGN